MDISKNPPYMFDKPKLDYFFKWRWWSAPVTFIPITAVAFFYSYIKLHTPLLTLMTHALIGMLLWSFFEYVIHRFLFHFIGKSPSLQHMHYVLHGMHHSYPTDPNRVIFSPISSALVGLVIALLMLALLPTNMALGLFGGFILAYCWYEFFHYAAHHIKWKFPWFSNLKRHHLLHHHSGHYKDTNFGVTSKFWDHVFGTYRP